MNRLFTRHNETTGKVTSKNILEDGRILVYHFSCSFKGGLFS